MKKEIKAGLAFLGAYLGYSLPIIIYTTFFCPNIYCEAFNVLAILPWGFWFEMQAKSTAIFISLFLYNCALFFFIGFFIFLGLSKIKNK